MTFPNVTFILSIMVISLLSNRSVAADAPLLKTEKEKLSYSMGVSFVRDFQKMGLDIDFDAMIRGIKDSSSGSHLLLQELEIRTLVNSFRIRRQLKKDNPVKPTQPPN